jgi:hypothetical protein
MSIAFPVTDKHVSWSAAVYLNTQYFRCVDYPRRSIGYDRARSSCTVTIDEYVEITVGTPVPAYVVIEARGEDRVPARRRFFTGFTDKPAVDIAPFGYSLTLVDILGQIDKPLASDVTWSNTTFENAVKTLLNDAGIENSQIGAIYDPGTDYNLGTVQDITLEAGAENVSKVIDELMKFAGCAIWVTPGGIIRVSYDVNIPRETGEHAYVWGDPAGDERGIYAGYSDNTSGSFEAITSGWIARGRRSSGGSTPTFTFNATGISGKIGSGTYRFAQSNSICEKIAKRETAKNLRPARSITIPCALDAEFLPATTINLTIPDRQGYSVNTTVLVRSIDTADGTMTLNAVLGVPQVSGTGFSESDLDDIGVGDDGHPLDTLFELFADFTITIDTEPIDVAGSLENRLFVHVDATQSASGTRTWSVTGATATPATPTGNEVTFLLDTADPTGVTINLNLDDGVATPVDVSKPLAVAEVQDLFRPISTATGSNGHRLLTRGGWQAQTRSGQTCTAVAQFNPNGAWSGWNDGAVYQWVFPGAPVLKWTHPTGTSISVIWVPENAQEIILVAAGSDLYLSTDEGESFTLLRSNATIADISTPPDNADTIGIAEGANVLESFDGGATWATTIVGAIGSTAESLAPAPWGNACAFSSAGSSADVVRFSQGYTVDWSAVGSAPTSLTTITPLLTEPGYIAGDGSGNLYLLLQNGSDFDATDIGTNASGNITALLRDGAVGGDSPFGDLCYVGDSGAGGLQGTLKLLNRNITHLYRIDNVSTATAQIGYLPVGATDIDGYRLLAPTWGAPMGSAGVWEYSGGTWSLRSAGLPTDVVLYGEWIAANPNNPNEWIALFHANTGSNIELTGKITSSGGTYSPFWLWDGSTWTEIVRAETSGPTSRQVYRVEYNNANEWVFVVYYDGTNVLVYGVGSGTTISGFFGVSDMYGSYAIAGDGDWVLQIQGHSGAANNDDIRYADNAGNVTRPSGSNVGDGIGFMARYPAGRELLLIKSDRDELWGTNDYRASQPVNLGYAAPQNRSIVINADNQVFHASSSGLVRVDNPYTSPAATTVAFSGVNLGETRIDTQNHRVVVSISGSNAHVYDTQTGDTAVIDLSGLTGLSSVRIIESVT